LLAKAQRRKEKVARKGVKPQRILEAIDDPGDAVFNEV